MVMALELVPRGASFTYDSWDGYKAERRELLDFIGCARASATWRS